MTDNALAEFVAEYSNVLLQLEQRKQTWNELDQEIRQLNSDIRQLEARRKYLNRRFVKIVDQLKED